MYADKITRSMDVAIEETNRRREIQVAYNKEHGIDPQPLRKKIADITDQLAREDEDTRTLLAQRSAANNHTAPVKGKDGGTRGRAPGRDQAAAAAESKLLRDGVAAAPAEDLVQLIEELSEQMRNAAAELKFELAGRLRDEIADLKKELRRMKDAGHA